MAGAHFTTLRDKPEPAIFQRVTASPGTKTGVLFRPPFQGISAQGARMRIRAASLIVAMCVTAAASQGQSKAAPKTMAGAAMPTWAQIEAKIRKQWAETYPKETIQSVVKVGEPAYNDEP